MNPRQPYTEVPYQPSYLDPKVGTPSSDAHLIPQEQVRGSSQYRTITAQPEAPASGHQEADVLGEHEETKPREDPPWYKEANMIKRILGVVAACAVVYLIYLGYTHYRDQKEAANGEVYGDDVKPQPSRSDTPGTVNGTPVRTLNQQSTATTNGIGLPATDTIAPNPTNGQTFAGTGKFQVYRQGNLTWRVNTETGETCILFATEEEWRKEIVYRHGCNAS